MFSFMLNINSKTIFIYGSVSTGAKWKRVAFTNNHKTPYSYFCIEFAQAQRTRGLIDVVKRWVTRQESADYFFTQMVSDRGSFRQYLRKFGQCNDPFYPQCPGETRLAEMLTFPWRNM